MIRDLTVLVCLLGGLFILSLVGSGCAQIGAPTGGPKDTLAPKIVKAVPADRNTQFSGKEIILEFDEYISTQEMNKNIVISPVLKYNPVFITKPKSITIRLKDTLQPNTTYTIQFRDAIRDVNEGNIFKDYVYTFSTGDRFDSLRLNGNVKLAETGKVDSTLMVLLYRESRDTAVLKERPDYISYVDGKGDFSFINLPQAEFRVYALKDMDGGKYYNSRTEIFAFQKNDVAVKPDISGGFVQLWAYEEEKRKEQTPSATTAPKPRNAPIIPLRFQSNAVNNEIDLLNPLELTFNRRIAQWNAQSIKLTDTLNKVIPAKIALDSTGLKIVVDYVWEPGKHYMLILDTTVVKDTLGRSLLKPDTLRLKARTEESYGIVELRFQNLDISKKPLLQLIQNNEVKYTYPLHTATWQNRRFPPGEYELRILYDLNGNGKWDAGNYRKNIQPELGVPIEQKLSVRANWENERDIVLKPLGL